MSALRITLSKVVGCAMLNAKERLMQRYGATPAQIALAWLLARSPMMLPIPGTGSVAHLEENVAATAIRLTREDVKELSRVG